MSSKSTVSKWNPGPPAGVSAFKGSRNVARLSHPPSRIGRLPARLGAPPQTEGERSRFRSANDPTRKLYYTKEWRETRIATFVRDDFTCQCGCKTYEPDTSKLVCDHVDAHRGDVAKFWAGPFQTLLKECHDKKKQREEQASLHRRGKWD